MKGRGRRGLKRYHAALRAIRTKHKGATHRDAQAVYRKLVRKTGGPVNARQVATARPQTTRKLLRQARAAGSRTTPRTKAQKQKQARLAKQFVEKQRQNKGRRGETKRPKTRKARTTRRVVEKGRKAREAAAGGLDDEGGQAASGSSSGSGAQGPRADAREVSTLEDFYDAVNDADDGDYYDVGEIESSADYGATD